MEKAEKSFAQKALACGGIAVLAALVMAGSKPHDSPVQVAGGSIYGSVGTFNLNTWTEIKTSQVYKAMSTNYDYLQFKGFTDSKGVAPPSPLQGTGGWQINIITKDSLGNPNPKRTITFCSYFQTSSSSPCTTSDKMVYVQASDDLQSAQWNKKWHYIKHRLRFHNNDPSCTEGIFKESVCNEIASIEITTVNRDTDDLKKANNTFTCRTNKDCSITVGK